MKTSELTGAVLDLAVAQCEGLETYIDDGVVCLKGQPFDDNSHYWLPSQNWSQSGPIIEREKITLDTEDGTPWRARFGKARITFDGRAYHYHHADGPTPLIAAMRTYVASKLGDEVEIPEELL